MPEFVDPYLGPASGILRNNLGSTDQRALDAAEADLVEARRVQMIIRPVKVTGDLRQLQSIHGQLFQDVYDWAGQLRTVDVRKGTDPGAEFFMPVSRLESGAGFAFAELADDNQLRGLDRDRFVNRIAHHYDQVNYLRVAYEKVEYPTCTRSGRATGAPNGSSGPRSPPALVTTWTGATSPAPRTTRHRGMRWSGETSPACTRCSIGSYGR